ncbi:MAG: NusG domain II-containing protein [Lachnospiraceae bacterium]|nr:NusG domain II-containing protein [Lachnospiraceae bacterium]
MNKKDIMLMITMLLIAGVCYLISNLTRNENGNQVKVSVDGKIYGTYPLYEDREIDIKTDKGNNVIVICDGSVSVKNADCKDKYCVKQGHVSKKNESIICLPHKLVVEITGKNEADKAIDSIAK